MSYYILLVIRGIMILDLISSANKFYRYFSLLPYTCTFIMSYGVPVDFEFFIFLFENYRLVHNFWLNYTLECVLRIFANKGLSFHKSYKINPAKLASASFWVRIFLNDPTTAILLKSSKNPFWKQGNPRCIDFAM